MTLNLGESGSGTTPVEQCWKRVAVFVRNDEGVTAIEYALMAALIAMSIVGTVGTVGSEVMSLWDFVADAVEAAVQ